MDRGGSPVTNELAGRDDVFSTTVVPTASDLPRDQTAVILLHGLDVVVFAHDALAEVVRNEASSTRVRDRGGCGDVAEAAHSECSKVQVVNSFRARDQNYF
jgi:hypothetical protein